ncbi:hypothetical protein ACFLZ7_01625 [Nanoarchaeota archaeon]
MLKVIDGGCNPEQDSYIALYCPRLDEGKIVMYLAKNNPINMAWAEELFGNPNWGVRIHETDDSEKTIKQVIKQYSENLPFFGVKFRSRRLTSLPLVYRLDFNCEERRSDHQPDLWGHAMEYCRRYSQPKNL